MKTIFKYPLEIIDDIQGIRMQEGAKIIAVQTQGNTPCIWAEVETDNKPIYRHFSIFGTGHELPSPNPAIDGELNYLGTCQTHEGALVWHVYEWVGGEAVNENE